MDKQKTQRIIGILVIIAFVIVLIPLFFGKTNVSTEVSSNTKPLALPEQPDTTVVAKADVNEGQTPDDSAILGSATPTPASTNNIQDNVSNTSDTTSVNTSENPNLSAPNSVSTDSASPVSTTTPVPTTIDTPNTPTLDQAANNNTPNTNLENSANLTNPQKNTAINTTAEVSDSLNNNTVSSKPLSEMKHTVQQSSSPIKKHKKIITDKRHSSKVKPVNLSSSEIEKLKSTAWVIQMGNFKDKDNARRLADKLRQAGYKAFTKEIKSAQGNIRTRVYIGPEFQYNSALHLSSKVEKDTKIHGIILSVKPLEI
jgi:cell division septation protein DedD